MKVKVKSIILILVCLLIINIPYLSQSINNAITLFIEIILFSYMLCNRNLGQYFYANLYVVTFWALMVICTFANFGFSSRTMNALVTGGEYFLIFYYISSFSKKESLQSVVSVLWKYILFVLIVVDIVVVVSKGNGIGNTDIVLNYYLIGNKFVVSYYHMFFLALFLARKPTNSKGNKANLCFVLLSGYSIWICYIVDCNTGIIGCLTVILLHIVSLKKNHVIELLSKPYVVTLSFVAFSLILVGTDLLLNNRFIYTIFKMYSHTSKLLSGRLDMYEITINGIKSSPWIGHGINCTLVQDVLTWGNPQNGLLKMLLDYGIVGTLSFILLFFDATKNKAGNDKQIEYAMLAFTYGMLVCSMVEINISGLFYLGLALLKMSKTNLEKNRSRL